MNSFKVHSMVHEYSESYTLPLRQICNHKMNFICKPIHCLLDTFTGGGTPPGPWWIQTATEMTFLGLIYLQFLQWRMKLYTVLVVVSSSCTTTVPAWLNNSIRFSVKATPYLSVPLAIKDNTSGRSKNWIKGNVETLKADSNNFYRTVCHLGSSFGCCCMLPWVLPQVAVKRIFSMWLAVAVAA